VLIGIDGGASKVSAWNITILEDGLFNTGEYNVKYRYKEIGGYNENFKPVDINTQMGQFINSNYSISESEEMQSRVYISACVKAVLSLVDCLKKRDILIGFCMPGIKTADDRGIAVTANGPRISSFCDIFKGMIEKEGINLIWKPMKIGNDAYFCGLGEQYGKGGSFRKFQNIYYCGVSTGIADLLEINGRIIEIDEVSDWFVKTWELASEDNVAIEDYISAKGVMKRFSEKVGESIKDVEKEGIYVQKIRDIAIGGNISTQEVIDGFCYYLAKLVYEIIVTLDVGYKGIFKIRNIYRKWPIKEHKFIGTKLGSVIFGQQIGEFLKESYDDELIWANFISNLKNFISKSLFIENDTKDYYFTKIDRDEFFVFSRLIEAPSIGAGVYAYFSYRGGKE